HDIGDYLSREDKLDKISDLFSINGIKEVHGWKKITPDCYNDWLNQRDDSFNLFFPIGNKKDKSTTSLFIDYSLGVSTNRDAWVFNSSKTKLTENIESLIDHYNNELSSGVAIDNVDVDPRKISWTRGLRNNFIKGNVININDGDVRSSVYRPFFKTNLYFSKDLNEMQLRMPYFFPFEGCENIAICLSGVGAKKGFSVFIVNTLFCMDAIEKGQSFPLYIYEKEKTGAGEYFDNSTNTRYSRKDSISDEGIGLFHDFYQVENIKKEDLFYYIYGLLHSNEYRYQYADNLIKDLPRIPCVKSIEDFWTFSKAGRELANLHLNYEKVERYKADIDTGSQSYSQLRKDDFYVEKMKFAKKGEKDTIIYNNKIRIKNIPIEAYDYILNGKSALEWVMERQGVSTHKDSGIVNDANDWAIETMNNPRYPLELFLRVITVSLETQKIVNSLPKLDI
ncbi:TPA: type ISP restriction/modification enzyme, partial [Morganella morganii]